MKNFVYIGSWVFMSFLFSSCSFNTDKKSILNVVNGSKVSDKDKSTISLSTVALTTSDNQFRCSGTLISAFTVLTAAHCVKAGNPTISLVKFNNKLTPSSPNIKVSKIIIHKDYKSDNDPSMSPDLAILQLKENAVEKGFGATVLGINENSKLPKNENLVIAGYGAVDSIFNETQISLRYATAWVTGHSSSNKGIYFSYSGDSFWRWAWSVSTGSCYGDSGGPVYYKIEGTYYIVGVVSHGVPTGTDKCGTDDSNAVNISFYFPWIRANIKKK